MAVEYTKKRAIGRFFDFAAPFCALFTKIVFFGHRRNYLRAVMNTTGVNDNIICLDVGAGPGEIAKVFTEVYEKTQYIGIDISKEAMKRAKKKANVSFIVADACHIPFRDEVFDLTMMWSAYGIINRNEAFSEMIRVLKEGKLVANCEMDYEFPNRYLRRFVSTPFCYYLHFTGKNYKNGSHQRTFLKN